MQPAGRALTNLSSAKFHCRECGNGTPFLHNLSQGLRLAADEVIYHDDVFPPLIIRSRGNATGCDPDPRDARIVKHDAEEEKASITWRGISACRIDRSNRPACWPCEFHFSRQDRFHPAGQRL
jgi:hypothetical protein